MSSKRRRSDRSTRSPSPRQQRRRVHVQDAQDSGVVSGRLKMFAASLKKNADYLYSSLFAAPDIKTASPEVPQNADQQNGASESSSDDDRPAESPIAEANSHSPKVPVFSQSLEPITVNDRLRYEPVATKAKAPEAQKSGSDVVYQYDDRPRPVPTRSAIEGVSSAPKAQKSSVTDNPRLLSDVRHETSSSDRIKRVPASDSENDERVLELKKWPKVQAHHDSQRSTRPFSPKSPSSAASEASSMSSNTTTNSTYYSRFHAPSPLFRHSRRPAAPQHAVHLQKPATSAIADLFHRSSHSSGGSNISSYSKSARRPLDVQQCLQRTREILKPAPRALPPFSSPRFISSSPRSPMDAALGYKQYTAQTFGSARSNYSPFSNYSPIPMSDKTSSPNLLQTPRPAPPEHIMFHSPWSGLNNFQSTPGVSSSFSSSPNPSLAPPTREEADFMIGMHQRITDLLAKGRSAEDAFKSLEEGSLYRRLLRKEEKLDQELRIVSQRAKKEWQKQKARKEKYAKIAKPQALRQDQEWEDLDEDVDNLEPHLPEEVLERVQEIWSADGVVVSGFNTDLTNLDFATLKDKQWLNDEIINFYGNLILERARSPSSEALSSQNSNANESSEGSSALKSSIKCHYFNSFFYTKLRDQGYKTVRRWTKKFDLFALDLVILPVHFSNHWCLGAINFRQRRIEYYDSLHGPADNYFEIMRGYLAEEYRDKKHAEFDFSDWMDYYPLHLIPRQLNYYDCGVYTCAFMEHVSRLAPMSFDQTHMWHWRRRITYEVASKQLLSLY